MEFHDCRNKAESEAAAFARPAPLKPIEAPKNAAALGEFPSSTTIQASIIMMSQNRQAAKNRLVTTNEINLKAELEIMVYAAPDCGARRSTQRP